MTRPFQELPSCSCLRSTGGDEDGDGDGVNDVRPLRTAPRKPEREGGVEERVCFIGITGQASYRAHHKRLTVNPLLKQQELVVIQTPTLDPSV